MTRELGTQAKEVIVRIKQAEQADFWGYNHCYCTLLITFYITLRENSKFLETAIIECINLMN